MVICIIAFVAFAVLGIFSAKYRAYFWEAADCVFKKATLRKCTTSFDTKMKMKISTRISGINKSLGSFVYKKFELLSLIMTVVMFVSIIATGYLAFMGFYNWYVFGNCNGPQSKELCVLNLATGKSTPVNTTTSLTTIDANTSISCPIDANGQPKVVQ